MVTGSSIVHGLHLVKLAKTPSTSKTAKSQKGGSPNCLKLKNAYMEAFEERASSSQGLDKSLSYKNIYWSRFTDADGHMLTKGADIADAIFSWADTQGSHYTRKYKDNKTDEIKESEVYRPLRKDAVLGAAIIFNISRKQLQKIPKDKRGEFINAVIGWGQSRYTLDGYAVHFDEGFDDGEHRHILINTDSIDDVHIHLFPRAVDEHGAFIGQKIADAKQLREMHKSFFEYMQGCGFDVVDNRNWRPEKIEEGVQERLQEFGDINCLPDAQRQAIIEQVTEEAKQAEAARAKAKKKEKAAKRNAYGVIIPKGCSRNEYAYLKNKQAANKEAEEILQRANDEAREIVDKANIDAEDILFMAQNKAVDIEQLQREIVERAEVRDAIAEAKRREEKANELIKENEQTRADWNAAIDKFNKDRAKLKAVQDEQTDKAALIEDGLKYREMIREQQRARVQSEDVKAEDEAPEAEEEARVKVAQIV